MARLIYVALALALGTLVAGFVVRDSSIPLLASIVLSAVVSVLILSGWSRRLRRSPAASSEGAPGEEEPIEEIEIIEVDEPIDAEFAPTPEPELDLTTPLRPTRTKAARARPPARKPAARKPAARKPAARKRTAARKVTPREPTQLRVQLIPGRSRYHAAGCRFIKGPDVREVTEAAARRRGYVPCSVCLPDAE